MHKDKLSAIVFGLPALLFLCIGLAGCKYESVPVTDYNTTNAAPSRFKVVSSEYYHMNGLSGNMSVTLLTDTQGTNEILIINNGHGIAMMYVPKPVKQLEENK
jgi:hypothetical protein